MAASSARTERIRLASRATSAGDAATLAPSPSARSGVRFHTIRLLPVSTSRSAIARPILPSPIMPMSAMGHSFLFVSFE
jgi:hypothetical protein